LIKPVNKTACHSERSEESARPMQAAQSTQSDGSAIGSTSVTTNLRFRQENRQLSGAVSSTPLKNQPPSRQQTTTNENTCHSERSEESAEPVQPAQPEPPKEKPTPLTLLKQGFTPISELFQDEYDYYLKNQGSTTYKQLNDLKRFSANRKAPPEIRQQIEQETGWLYHPDDTNYGKRQPNRPLVRTKFPGPPTNWH
jgi:hypothetical protein